MLKNYFKIAIRNLTRQQAYSLINIIGLTFGITSFLLIMMYVQYESSFDKQIPDYGRIYRMVEIQIEEGVGEQHVAITMGPLAPALKADFPEVKDAVRLLMHGRVPVRYENKQFNEDNCFIADPSVLVFFGIRMLSGNPQTALLEKQSVVISEDMAKRYFGSAENAIGKTLEISKRPGMKVSGVMENFPKNMHLQCGMFVSIATFENQWDWLKNDWGNNSVVTYISLKEGTDYKQLEAKLPDFIKRHVDRKKAEYGYLSMYLQPLSDVHLKSNHIKFQIQFYQGSIILFYLFLAVAIIILLIACVNFINLAIAQSVKRAKEVGIRKTLGANRSNLIYQFIGESFIVTFVSLIFAVGLVELLLPRFNSILETNLRIDFMGNPLFNVGLFIILLIVSLLSGSYPAFYLSRFQPVVVLKGKLNGRSKQVSLRKTLVVFQFTISVIMIFSVMIVFAQIKYMVNKNLGYNYDNLISIPVYDKETLKKSEVLKNELLKIPLVNDVVFSSGANGASGSQGGICAFDSTRKRCMVRYGFVDYNFFKIMEIPLVEGRYFDKKNGTDSTAAVILNQAAVREFGWKQPLGKKIQFIGDTKAFTVVGIIRDYHYYSLHSKIEPAAFFIFPENYNTLLIKVKASTGKQIIPEIEKVWKSVFPESPFEYEFVKRQIKNQYRTEENVLIIFIYFTILSLVISCLGLYGLTSLIVEQRTKEIGLRKVMGGSNFRIIKMLNKEFIRLVLLAGIISIPLTWYFSGMFLNNFAYHISVGWYYFAVSILVALFIAIFTVSFKSLKAANANPVKSLKYE